MDTETVFKVITMLDARIGICEGLLNGTIDEDFDIAYVCGEQNALTDLRNHLQGYIELQVAQVEGT